MALGGAAAGGYAFVRAGEGEGGRETEKRIARLVQGKVTGEGLLVTRVERFDAKRYLVRMRDGDVELCIVGAERDFHALEVYDLRRASTPDI